jgi:predicted ATPase
LPLDKVRCCAKVLWDRGDAAWMKPLVDAVTGLSVYESYELRKVKRSEAVELRQDSLHADGANLWSVLAHWKGSAIRSEGRFDWVMATAREAFPGQISTIEFERGFPVLYPPGTPDPDRGLPPERAADGLLTGLLHLTAIAGAPPGSLVAFDELENQLHPHAIRTLLAAMRERADAQGLTVILTTHSPVVMNQFRDELEHVFVLDRSDPERPQPVALTALHTEEWLAQAKLGTLYERLAFGSPLPAPPPP